nr:hypothetical protein [Tanacetum cinerariifolium]
SDIRIQEKKANLFNEWEMFTFNDGESIESYYHHFLKLMNDLKRNKHFPEKIARNLKFLNNLQPEWSRHVTIVHRTKDLHIADYTQLYDFLKYNQKEVDELKAERIAKTQDPIALMVTSNNPYNFSVLNQDQPSFNQNYMQQPITNPEDITNLTTVMNMALALMAKAFKLNYSTPTNNNQRISSNPCNRQITQPGMNMGQDRQMQMVGGNANQNLSGNGNLVATLVEGNAAGHNGNQIRIQEKKANLFNKWEMFTFNDGESIESYYHHFLKLMNDLKRNKHFPEKIARNLKFLNNLQPEWSRHVTIVHRTKDLHIADYTQLYDFLKYNQKEVDELKAERIAKTQDPIALMVTSNNPYNFSVLNQDQPSFNQNYMQQPITNPEDITNLTTVMNMALALMAKAFKLNYSTPTNNNQRISSNPCNRQITQPGMNMGQDRQMQMRISSNPMNGQIAQSGMKMGQDRPMQMIGGNGRNQFRQYAVQNAGNPAGYNDVIGNQNQIRNGNLMAVRAEGNAAGHNENQIRCYNYRGV